MYTFINNIIHLIILPIFYFKNFGKFYLFSTFKNLAKNSVLCGPPLLLPEAKLLLRASTHNAS